MRKSLNILLVFVISFILQFTFMWLRGGYVTALGLTSLPLSTLILVVLYFIGTVVLLKKFNNTLPIWGILTTIIIGASIVGVHLIVRKGLADTLGVLPEYIFQIIAIMAGCWYYKISNKTWRIIVVSSTLLLTIWNSYWGYDLWISYIKDVSTTSSVHSAVEQRFDKLYKSDGSIVSLDNLNKEYIVLTFMGSEHGDSDVASVMKQLHDEYNSGDKVGVYSIHDNNNEAADSLNGIPCLRINIHGLSELELDYLKSHQTYIYYRNTVVYKGGITEALKRLKEAINQ